MKFKLRTKISLAISSVVILTVLMTSFFANILLNKQFTDYRISQIDNSTKQIINSVSLQYSAVTGKWDNNFVHTIGMQALSNGFIIAVKDNTNNVIWDAQTCDMQSCEILVSTMTQKMREKKPGLDGGFTTKNFDLTANNQKIGNLSIKYYSPYFLSENDLLYIDNLNSLLILIGIIALLISIFVGFVISKRLANPILKTVDVTRQIANGTYNIRIDSKTNTSEVVDLMDSVNLLATSLDRQENIRKQLTADVAHELRTPLATLSAHLEAMLEGVWEPTPERLASCQEEVVRISKMVLDLENLAKLEYNNMNLHFTTISLSELSKKVVFEFDKEIKSKNLHVSLDAKDIEIYADSDRMHQVITNLLSNAVKYTPENGTISIKIEKTPDAVRFSIKDNGIGISQEDLPYVFERFYRADKSRNRNTGGSGIGLAIVKSIVTAHGGQVKVLSEIGKGSEFIIEFPV